MRRSDTLVFIPTYNERENVEELCREILALNLGVDVLFVDDNSPDGTGEVLDGLAREHPEVRVLHREGKLGIGSAHLHGIFWAYDQGYGTLVTMDCDFTHSPSDIPRLLEILRGCDVAVGSRFLQDGSLPGWKASRKMLTLLGHFVTRHLLGNPYDSTGALRAYNLKRVPRTAFEVVRSRGYAFFLESLSILHRNHFAIRELPIVLPVRTYGHSKMSMKEVYRSMGRLCRLYLQSKLNPQSMLVLPPLKEVNPALVDPQGWDDYWKAKSDSKGVLYDLIASAYRTCVIRRRLNWAIASQFPRGSRLLHAGCGGGQVDGDIPRFVDLTAADISVPALQLYLRNNPKVSRVVHASILDLPFPAGSFDGVYNLGVMEHFTREEIEKILREFHRVLKPQGRIVLFWPHARASSVKVLGAAHWVLNDVLHKNVRLHAPEVSLMQSRRQAADLLKAGGFDLAEYRFGIQDFYVQAILVGRKAGLSDIPSRKVLTGAGTPA